MQRFVHLETVLRRAPLGLRFLDLAGGLGVHDGLTVVAWQLGTTEPRLVAQVSPLSGVYGFRTLPGLRAFEEGEQPASDWCGSPPNMGVPTLEELLDLDTLRGLLVAESGGLFANFIVAIEDRFERFLPQVLLMCLPKERLIEVPLFSAPARIPAAGSGVVRGEIWERAGNQPAGWALVTASPDGATTYAAVADGRGMFMLLMPYASGLPPLVGSPPHGSGAIDQLSWPLTMQVFYQPSRQRRVPSLIPPDIRSILEQAAAQVYDTTGSHAATLTRAIRFGQELVVTTNGLSRVLVDPA